MPDFKLEKSPFIHLSYCLQTEAFIELIPSAFSKKQAIIEFADDSKLGRSVDLQESRKAEGSGQAGSLG